MFYGVDMNKIELKDTTFMIPFRCDSQDRLDNLELVVDYITHHFDTNIIVKESSEISILENCEFIKKVKYIWEFSDSEIFHRTKILNDMLEDVKTDIVVNYDTDVLFPVQSYLEAQSAIRNGKCIVFPYLGKFYEIPRKHIPEIKEKMEVNWIDLDRCGINHNESVGGAMFLNTAEYKRLGGENVNMISWGGEDNFRVNLFSKFGHEICRVGTSLYHMEHFRSSNSGPNHVHYYNNMQIYYNMMNMSREELFNYINTYNRFK